MARSSWLMMVFSALLCLLSLTSISAAAQSNPSFQAHLSEMQKYAGDVGIQVVALPSGRPVWEYRPEAPMVPASLVKVLTSYAALKNLGPFHHFATNVYALQEPRNGIVDGDIWIKSEGDFHLVGENLWSLANELRQKGIRLVKGGIRIDNGFFEPKTEKICLDGKCSKPYNPVLSGTAVDFNTISLLVLPGDREGSAVQVKWLPPGDYVQIANRAVTSGKSTRAQLKIVSRGVTPDGREKIELSGRVPIRSTRGYRYRFNVRNPAAFAGFSLREACEKAGIEFTKETVRTSAAPAGAVKLLAHESMPLSESLYGLNRYSNNFMAEMLLRSLGGTVLAPPGTAAKGLAVVRQTLEGLGISPGEARLDSGSGLSRTCRVSPRAFCRVLTSVYSDFSIAPEFLTSLAMNAEEGTLKKRLRKSQVTVRGKTGSLKDVCAFAGYVSYPGKEIYAVTVLLNQVKDPWEARRALYDFLEAVPTMTR